MGYEFNSFAEEFEAKVERMNKPRRKKKIPRKPNGRFYKKTKNSPSSDKNKPAAPHKPEESRTPAPPQKKMTKQAAPARHWVLTSHNTKDYKNWKNLDLQDAGVRNLTYQLEQCPKTDKLHVQAYVEFYDKVRIAGVKDRLNSPGLHCEKRLGTRQEAREYCMKEDSRVPGTEYVCLGTFPTKQGNRTDLQQVADYIMTGANEQEVAEAFPCIYLRCSSHIRRLINVRARKTLNEYKKIDVHVLWGDTGAGKTRTVIERHGAENVFIPIYSESAGKFWFDGYTGQKVLLINEFYGQARVGYMLELLDNYRKTLEVKGDTVVSAWDTIYITSNCHPREWFENRWASVPDKPKAAVARRIDTITELKVVHKKEVIDFDSKPELDLGRAEVLVLPSATSGTGTKRSAGPGQKPQANEVSDDSPFLFNFLPSRSKNGERKESAKKWQKNTPWYEGQPSIWETGSQ